VSRLIIDGSVTAVAATGSTETAGTVADVAWYGLEAYARRGVAWSAGRGRSGCGTPPAVET
jgi:hypothetical protein